MNLLITQFEVLIPIICSAETSSHPESWTKENPTEGHCAIVSVLAQELFGGEIAKVSLKNTKYENLKSHFFNIIDGKERDFTVAQFAGNIPYEDMQRVIESREKILSYPETQKRYESFKNKVSTLLQTAS